MKTPVVLIVFNRPEHTAQVMKRIREMQPEKLYVVADAPREEFPEEADLCEQTRQAVLEAIDWRCDLQTDFAQRNLGCARRVSSGLDWVFEQEETAVILEDDCLVDMSFIPFAESLLERYRHNESVMAISASRHTPFTAEEPDLPYSLTTYFHCWGWATWKRAWHQFDFSLDNWRKRFSPQQIERLLGSEQRRYWSYILDRTHRRENSWAYRFQFNCWEHNGLSIIPRHNLTENIGFDESATHTLPECHNPCSAAESQPPILEHPAIPPRNHVYEMKVAANLQIPTLQTRACRKVEQLVQGLVPRPLF